MPFTKFTNLNFAEIKESVKDYLRANSDFKDFDFEGSNMSIIVDILAYNSYITAFNSNMVANESFLDSATLREIQSEFPNITKTVFPLQLWIPPKNSPDDVQKKLSLLKKT